MLGAGAEVEEAVQEGFVKAYYALPRFRQESPFRPWLLTIVANDLIWWPAFALYLRDSARLRGGWRAMLRGE